MSLYGDPALGMNEAGYYLTTLSVAANFIEKKLQQKELATPEQLVPFNCQTCAAYVINLASHTPIKKIGGLVNRSCAKRQDLALQSDHSAAEAVGHVS